MLVKIASWHQRPIQFYKSNVLMWKQLLFTPTSHPKFDNSDVLMWKQLLFTPSFALKQLIVKFLEALSLLICTQGHLTHVALESGHTSDPARQFSTVVFTVSTKLRPIHPIFLWYWDGFVLFIVYHILIFRSYSFTTRSYVLISHSYILITRSCALQWLQRSRLAWKIDRRRKHHGLSARI